MKSVFVRVSRSVVLSSTFIGVLRNDTADRHGAIGRVATNIDREALDDAPDRQRSTYGQLVSIVSL